MPTNVLLPQWGMNMQDGVLLKWLKREGELVEEGEPLVEIETAKILSELEAPASGVLASILVSEGQTVDVGTVLAVITAEGEELIQPVSETKTDAGTASTMVQSIQIPATPTGLQVVPAARRLAQEEGIDLNLIHGSGPNGRILLEDVISSVTTRDQVETNSNQISGIRKTIADRMLQSTQTMAQVTLTTEVDVSEMVERRRSLVATWRKHRVRPMDLDLVVEAVAKALPDHPQLNATLVGDALKINENVNIGIAMAQVHGIIVPVLHSAEKLNLLEIASGLRDLAKKAKDGSLAPSEVAGAGFTITSLANYEIDAFTPIIDPPQVAILGVGRVLEKPAVHNGEIAIRSIMHLSLTFNHRATDGVPASQFLQAVTRELEKSS